MDNNNKENNMDTVIKPQATVQLQSIGRVAAKPAGELQVGDITLWNFGYTSTVTKIQPRGKTQIIVHLATEIKQLTCTTVTTSSRLMSKTRLVAVKGL